jgi:flagellar biosynthesis protein FlhF
MVEETFIAPTPRDAFELAREKYGAFSDLKLLRATQQRDEEGKLRAHIVVAVPQEDYLASIGIDEEEELVGEIQQLRDQMARMKAAIAPDTEASTPNTIDEVKAMMRAKGIQSPWLDALLDPLASESVAEDKSLLISYILEEMDEMIRILPEETEGRKTLMLIGPTGVGKTTTLAKLAARYALNEAHPRSVALLNLDTFRVGAYEQMEHYASAMGLRHIKVDTIEGFGAALDELADYDVVLIDTAGISPYDIGRLVKTVEFLRSLPERDIETALVISATAKYDDIVAIHEHFSFMEVDSVILTKFDETRRIGEALGFVLEHKLPISYVSTGQEVPDDLEPADKENLMIRFVEELHV